MRITHSTAAERAAAGTTTTRQVARAPLLELGALLFATLVSLGGAWLVYAAKSAEHALATQPPGRAPVNLNEVDRAEVVLPALEGVLNDPAERRFAAERVAAWLTSPGSGASRRHVEGVGALAAIRVSEKDLGKRGLLTWRERLAARRAPGGAGTAPAPTVPLFTQAELSALRPGFVVRSWATFRNALIVACLLFPAGFLVPFAWGRARRLLSDPVLLPAVQLLAGIGLAMMVSLRDPIRDPLLFGRFAQGVCIGGLLLAAVRGIDFQRSQIRRLSFVPLLAAVALSALLIVFGSGPGSSDAKVNLLGVQPVEAIRLLVVLFLAGYFANRWELLRSLKEPALGSVGRLGFDVPRLDYVLPVLVGMALVLVFFFLQKDLGPAMVLACVFLAMYGIARRRVTMVVLGLLLLAAGFVGGYLLGFPHTVVQRVQIWASPWDNLVRGGDQIAHALWALAAGAVSGTGLGLGDPHFIPAGHTDLVLAVVGEELGFVGLLVVFTLFALVAYRCLRIALAAPGDYTFFLALGLTLGLVLQLTLIAAGLLGLMPLTGVATPFLSYGRSSMIANFVSLGVLLAIRAHASSTGSKPEFERPAWTLAAIVGTLLVAAVVKAGYIQVVRADATLAAPVLTVQGDGERRFGYNPRLLLAADQIVRGTVFDRNGIPLATSKPADLSARAAELASLGASTPDGCAAPSGRCYPFGGLTFHLLGDYRSQLNWAASNTSFVERDSDVRLRGYDDHARIVEVADPAGGGSRRILRRDLSELVPLVRNRYRPQDAAVKALLSRPRDVKVSLDIRLQLKVAALLKAAIDQAGRQEGAAVVLSEDGDLLAAASYPWPATLPGAGQAAHAADTTEAAAALLDRARYGSYPPGSSFKLVTATAALRKDPAFLHQTFTCERLPDGRVGQKIAGWGRPIRDDLADRTPHGTLDLERALVVSCNAYFAQLGLRIGGPALQETAALYEIPLGQPETVREVRDTLPYAAYGQGQVLASPFKMARVAATIAGGGTMPQGRWVIDETNRRVEAPRPVLAPAAAQTLARVMREVVLDGTGRSLRSIEPGIAGKTGTAEVQNAPSHSWFVGFAPFAASRHRIAFAVLIEHGGYGASAAAPVAGRIVTAAHELGIIGER